MGRGRALAYFAVAVIIGHHVGTLFAWLGGAGNGTRWADWIDLLVPFAVLGAADAVLARFRAPRVTWILLGVGTVLYTQGHGIHLAANSIGNAEPSDVAHFWDETVSHYLWYAGLVLVVVALTWAVGAEQFQVPVVAWALVVLFGLTWATNSVEGGTPVFGLVVAAVLAWRGWLRRRAPAGALLGVAFGTALLALAGWGVWHGGFPQFSELGWI